MEMQLKSTSISYLEPVAAGSRNLEQTQQIRLPDGMPDVERIIGCWGQTVLRSKEWRSDTLTAAGGVLVWVLYQPEDGSQLRALDGWISFQGKWDLPENNEDGHMMVQSVLRSLDARPVSPRKILVRAGIGLNCLALMPKQAELYRAEQVPEDVQLLRKQYPLRLYTEAGEKSFALEDTLSSAGEDLADWSPLYYTAQANLTDQKVVGDKIAFRGAVTLHVLLQGPEGRAEGRNFTFPFSQLAELERSNGSDGEAELQLCVTNLEVEKDAEGVLHLKAAFTAQYAVSDVTTVSTVEDGYSTQRELKITREELALSPIRERRWETMSGEAALPEQVHSEADLSTFSDFPIWDRQTDGYCLDAQGTAQLLSYDDKGLTGTQLRWSGHRDWKTEEPLRMAMTAFVPGEPQLNPGAGKLCIDTRFRLTCFAEDGIPVISAMELGETVQKDPARPSLILRRAGEGGLWELAKRTGSTMEAIRQANGLEGEPEKGRMLLIPVL